VETPEFLNEKGWLFPSSAYLKCIKKERVERTASADAITARNLLYSLKKVSLGVSPYHYRFFCLWQLLGLYARNCKVEYTGLQNIKQDIPKVFVMKHRGFADITLHGFGYAWATSGLPLIDYNPFENLLKTREVIAKGKPSRFLMKEDLLSLPIGYHLVVNGGIPILQDHETKTLNNPGYDMNDPKVQKKIKKMSTWFSFKNSYREILNVLNNNDSIMIYGEATRVSGDKMGHLSTKFLKRLSKVKNVEFIPVGSIWTDTTKKINYGAACEIEALRDNIAELSDISKEDYL
jgi:1-acyl-sn-glycerol-3-phosphate acyltransferase